MITQVVFKVVWILPAFNMVGKVKSVWTKLESSNTVMFYFYLASLHIFALLPPTFYKTIHTKFEKLDGMLEAIAHSSLLTKKDSKDLV